MAVEINNKKHATKNVAVYRIKNVIVRGKKSSAPISFKVKFGSVTVVVHSSSGTELKRNIKAGQAALHRAKNVFLKPGVKIAERKDVPFFSADPSNPNWLIRRLNGKEKRGVLTNGRFEVRR